MNITSIPDIPKTPSQGDEFGIDKYESKSESIDVHTSKIIWLKFSLFGFGLIVPPISGIILLILVLLN